jgi:hypothetical protein
MCAEADEHRLSRSDNLRNLKKESSGQDNRKGSKGLTLQMLNAVIGKVAKLRSHVTWTKEGAQNKCGCHVSYMGCFVLSIR